MTPTTPKGPKIALFGPKSHLQALLPPQGRVVEFVIGVEDPPQVNPTELFGGPPGLQVTLQPPHDGTDPALRLQVLHVLCQDPK